MKIIIQRVLEASVEVESKIISQIGSGLLVLVGFEEGDGAKEMESALSKLRWGRFFENEEGRPHYSAFDL
jgi:D-tyrosyl-tRNA(Tyr) deacylase